MCPKRSHEWLKEHFTDEFVKKAHKTGYRSRAVFKLQELNDKFRLFKPGMVVVDLGAAPGSWSQYVVEKVGKSGKVFALDILEMAPLDGVIFIQGDFNLPEVQDQLSTQLKDETIDWVISDMLPNMSGIESVDLPRSMYLAECAFEFALNVLPEKGNFLIKLLQGEGFEDLLKLIRRHFKKVNIRKPKASRDRSREVYIVAMDKK